MRKSLGTVVFSGLKILRTTLKNNRWQDLKKIFFKHWFKAYQKISRWKKTQKLEFSKNWNLGTLQNCYVSKKTRFRIHKLSSKTSFKIKAVAIFYLILDKSYKLELSSLSIYFLFCELFRIEIPKKNLNEPFL